MSAFQQQQAQEELQMRLIEALDHLHQGAATPDDLALINYYYFTDYTTRTLHEHQ